MKRSLMLTALVAVATLLSMNAMAEPDPDFHIYLCFGQSNMEGQAVIEDADCSYDERFWMMSTVDCGIRQSGKWYNALPPLSRCGKGLCPADYFGRAMLANLDEKKQVGVVVVAKQFDAFRVHVALYDCLAQFCLLLLLVDAFESFHDDSDDGNRE